MTDFHEFTMGTTSSLLERQDKGKFIDFESDLLLLYFEDALLFTIVFLVFPLRALNYRAVQKFIFLSRAWLFRSSKFSRARAPV
jgi:hypothetical protein